MADVFTPTKRSQVMSRIRSEGNAETELRLIALFRAEGITGWRRNYDLPGKPDFVFRKERLVIFVDGCFWHGCPKHGRNPTSNRDYWLQKLRRNRKRDTAVKRDILRLGWKVLRFWEHDLADRTRVARLIIRALDRSRSDLRRASIHSIGS